MSNSGEPHADKVVTEDHPQENVDINKKLEEKEKEAAANYDKYLRAVAELDNYRKRAAREKTDIIKYGNEDTHQRYFAFYRQSGSGFGARHRRCSGI
jgi:molecular chaperone GrpE